MRALVSITVDHDFAVHDIKVIEGPERTFVAMPSRKDESGAFRDICHPITPEARKQIETAILSEYERNLEKMKTEEAGAAGENNSQWPDLDHMLDEFFSGNRNPKGE